jgi:hypothetical protein
VQNIARASHYVPQAVLRRWSVDGNNVYSYRVLVSRAEVPEWESKPVRGVALQQDLYTVFSGGQEVDEFEQWINTEYEAPGLEAIDRLINASRLTPADWSAIARFVAAQDLRTPLNFLESRKRWAQQIPAILDECLHDAVEELVSLRSKSTAVPPRPGPNELGRLLRVHIEPGTETNSDQALIRAQITVGRSLWIASMHLLLQGAANVLCEHRWSVAEPHGNEEWVMTDHPVLRLNCYGSGNYDFGGGWDNPGSEIMMPLSHRHLLYVQVGQRARNRFSFSREDTRTVQRLIVERAHRWVFAREPVLWVSQVKPRVVNQDAFLAEQNAWKHWHEEELRAEKE